MSGKDVKLSLRPIAFDDLDWAVGLRNAVSQNLGDATLVGEKGQQVWFEGLEKDSSREYFILEDKEVIGGGHTGLVRMTSIDWIHRSACVGGDIHPAHQGKGHGATMMDLIKQYCFDVLNLHRLWLLVLQTNERAISVYHKASFIKEGVQRKAIRRNGKWLDYVMMSLLEEEYR